MSRPRRIGLIVGVVAVVGSAVAAYFIWQATDECDLPPMSLFREADGKSDDLAADIERMWTTQLIQGNTSIDPPPNSKASTAAAIPAASRVFNTVQLIGKTRDEVIALLGDPRASNDSVYNFPFYPAPKGCLVYRFDTGSYGWQFNLVFGRDGRVSEVRRYGIE